jgi:hypothetical protein
MSKVTVYQFTVYDIASDNNRKSRRWATREAVALAGGCVLEETDTEIDESLLGSEIEGMSARDFDPRPHTGFQRQVFA